MCSKCRHYKAFSIKSPCDDHSDLFIPSLSHLACEEKSRLEALQCLSLSELQKDEGVTPAQMVSCCSRLIEESWRLLDPLTSTGGVSLQGSRLRVSHYYSVMQDGLICIPWDWVGEDDL